jgi:thioredoxin-like negative regulator of GroEL
MPEASWETTGLEVLRTADFEATNLKRDGLYAVCFGATWCRPTRHFVPKFVGRSGHSPGKFAMGDITDRNDPLWDSFQIRITPTMVVFLDGRPMGRFDGRRFIGLREPDLDRMSELLERLGSESPASVGSRSS